MKLGTLQKGYGMSLQVVWTPNSESLHSHYTTITEHGHTVQIPIKKLRAHTGGP